MWRQPRESGDPPSIELTKFRELCDQSGRDDRSDPLDAAKTHRLIAQLVLALDHGFLLCFDFRQAALQGPDVL